jgi:phosphoribosylaminoimidazolecarboxamide formyltransferase/IMP cyclohydrolase
VLDELRRDGALSDGLRRRLAAAAFAHTAAYDAAIANWFAEGAGEDATSAGDAAPVAGTGPALRYGENPHQRGARYREVGEHSWWDDVVQHGGNGPLLPQPLRRRRGLAPGPPAGRPRGPAAAVVVKHANPCGAAVAGDVLTAYDGRSSATPCRPSAASWP